MNLPGLMGFVQYCAYNMAETVRLYGGSLVEKTAAEAALTLIAGMEKVIIKTLKDAGYHAPMPFSELIKLPEQSHTIGMGCKMGEGWLLTAEMLELVRPGMRISSAPSPSAACPTTSAARAWSIRSGSCTRRPTSPPSTMIPAPRGSIRRTGSS